MRFVFGNICVLQKRIFCYPPKLIQRNLSVHKISSAKIYTLGNFRGRIPKNVLQFLRVNGTSVHTFPLRCQPS